MDPVRRKALYPVDSGFELASPPLAESINPPGKGAIWLCPDATVAQRDNV